MPCLSGAPWDQGAGLRHEHLSASRGRFPTSEPGRAGRATALPEGGPRASGFQVYYKVQSTSPLGQPLGYFENQGRSLSASLRLVADSPIFLPATGKALASRPWTRRVKTEPAGPNQLQHQAPLGKLQKPSTIVCDCISSSASSSAPKDLPKLPERCLG